MIEITIDETRCKKDGLCAIVCPKNIFIQHEKLTIPEVTGAEGCITCGQCVAICPQNAVIHTEFPVDTFRPIEYERMPTSDQVMEMLKSRRSIRVFRDKPIAKETIEQIIEGARFAPSGHNSQSTKYIVVQDRSLLAEISATAVEYLKFEIKRFSNPFFKGLALMANRESAESGLHEIPGFKKKVEMFESGADPILNGAPALLAFYAPNTDGFGDVNTQLAIQNASLTAHSLGIGHFYTGWVIAPGRAPLARAWHKRIPDLIGVPTDHTLHGALALGHPIPRFKNILPKNAAEITWV